MEDLFEKVPGFRLIKQNNKFFVDASAPSEVAHITEMIAKQKSAPKKYPKKFVQRPVSIFVGLDVQLFCFEVCNQFNIIMCSVDEDARSDSLKIISQYDE